MERRWRHQSRVEYCGRECAEPFNYDSGSTKRSHVAGIENGIPAKDKRARIWARWVFQADIWGPPGPSWRLLCERLDRVCFVVLDVEDGVEFGDLEQVVNLFGQIQELQFAAAVADGGESADQFADA